MELGELKSVKDSKIDQIKKGKDMMTYEKELNLIKQVTKDKERRVDLSEV